MECYKDNVMLPYVSKTNETLKESGKFSGLLIPFQHSLFVVHSSLFIKPQGARGRHNGHKGSSVVSVQVYLFHFIIRCSLFNIRCCTYFLTI